MARAGKPRLLERETEVTRLEESIAELEAGVASVVVVEGPAGIGKTTLLAAAREIAARRGLQVTAARGSPLEAELAFGVVLQLFSGPIAKMSAGGREALFAGAAGLTRGLFDPHQAGEIGEVAATGAPSGGVLEAAPSGPDESLFLLHGLHWLVVNLANERPLLIAVDDAHWADNESLRFLHYLAQRLDGLAVGIAVTVREGEPTPAPLEELRAHSSARIIRPAPLSDEAVETLVAEELPEADGEFRAACARATAGNPLYLHQLLAAAVAEGLSPTAEGARSLPQLGPRAVGRVVLSRLGRMNPAAQRLARAAAIAGDGSSLADVAAAAGLDAAPARAAADALVAADVLRAVDSLAFAHPIVRDAIYGELPPAERAAGHLAVARSLSARGARPEAIAVHALEAERGAEPWLVDALCAAAERARERGAPALASRYLDRALAEGGGGERRGEILFRLGLSEAQRGHRRGIELISEAASEIDDPEQRAFTLMNLGRILGIGGRYRESAEAFRRAGEVLSGSGSAMEWWPRAGFAMSGSLDPQTRAEALKLMGELLERPDLESLPVGRSLLAFAALERVYAARPAAEAMALARRAAAVEPLDIEQDSVAFRIAASVHAMCGEFEAAEQLLAKMEEAAREQGSALEVAAASYLRMQFLMARGRPSEAVREALAAIDAQRLGWGVAIPATHVGLAWGHLERGELDEAAAALELPGGDERWKEDHSLALVVEMRAALRLARGDAQGALADLEAAGERLDDLGVVNPAVSAAPWRTRAAIAAASVGDRARAVRLADGALELSERFGSPRAIADARRARGLALEGEAGLAELRRSVETVEGSPFGLELARALTELGAALRRSGSKREARVPLRRGLDLARRCGALALAERAHTELRATGARPRRLLLSGVESLTPSERRVAELAAAGLTNRQIAEQLFLTKKTVEAHLGSVYRKLAISSRTELPEALTGDPDGAGRVRVYNP